MFQENKDLKKIVTRKIISETTLNWKEQKSNI